MISKNKIFFICLPFFLVCQFSLAQTYILYGDKTFGGNKNEEAWDSFLDSNNNLIIGGVSYTNIGGDKTDSLCNLSLPNNSDLWVLKVDTTFNILWQNDIGGNKAEITFQIFKSNLNNNYFFASQSNSGDSCDKTIPNKGNSDNWFGTIENSGNLLWDNSMGGSEGEGG